MRDKPTIATGYRKEDTHQVVAACLTFAAALGDLAGEFCIVGGLVPSMICDADVDPSAIEEGAHVGTNDLDVALEVTVLDEEHYKEISKRLRNHSFAPDTTGSGGRARQRWRWKDEKVTVDFLIPPAEGIDPDRVRLQDLEADFAALIVKPLGLAFEERVERELEGHTLEGDAIVRTVAFCGPAAFVALKAYAFAMRHERKDAYDLVYVLRRWPGGISDIADRLARHAENSPELVREIVGLLQRDFSTVESTGTRSVSRFHDDRVEDDRVADAHGAVRDFLDACAGLGLAVTESGAVT
jgi:hypothetical protein